MALFSRKKSKAKKAAKEEEKKAAADAKAAAATKAPQRGRNGKIVQPPQPASESGPHNIPVPSQPPRDFHTTSNGSHRSQPRINNGFEESGEKDYYDPYSSGDSGYTSGPASQTHSRTPSTHKLRQDRDQFALGSKSTPQLTLRDDFAGEPAFPEHPFMDGDAIESHRAAGTLKSSKSLHAIRKYVKPEHEASSQPEIPPLQQPYQDARYQRRVQQSMPMRPSSVPAQSLQSRSERVSRSLPQRSSSPGPILQGGHAVQSPRPRDSAPYGLQSSQFHPRSPTSPTANDTHANLDHDAFTPSLNILNGLKVNKRGLILDEEGDPIGELYEGDIIDCVRQKTDGYGEVLDEYGRVVGRVRTLPSTHSEPILRPFTPKSMHREQYQDQMPVPPIPSEYMPKDSHRLEDDRTVAMQQPMQAPKQEMIVRDGPSSPIRTKSVSHRRDTMEQEDDLTMHQQDHNLSHRPNNEQPMDQHEPFLHRFPAPSGSMPRSESLPSVPESHSTAEIALSDDGSTVSERSHQSTTEEEPSATHDQAAGSGQVNAVSRQSAAPPRGDSLPSLNRSASSPAPKSLSEFKKPGLPSTNGALGHAQPIGLLATPNRLKSPPLPSFPGRSMSGLPGGSPFAAGPMPGMPSRRLTTPGFPTTPSLGMNGFNAPPLRFRASGTTPLVRSPLSSQENSPPDSEQGSAQGDSKPVLAQAQSHTRSQSLRTANTATTTPAGGRRKFGHASQPAADKQADIVVKEVKEEKKKKGMKGLFGRKK